MHWTESIDVDRPVPEVRAAIADEHELMQWSAWPEATGYTCSVDGDGVSPGSEIVFRDRSGVVQGRQRLLAASDDRVEYRLRNRLPAGREMTPEVDFRIEDLGGGRSRVHLDFRATPPLPPVLRQLAGLVAGRRVRALHVRDLEQLKAHVERRPAVP
ncbi:MAG TPA: SRPBCC family protein [Geodermatophilus sp.]|nr:SRPBCC family protein [Geodermatophilus sp.]